MLSVQLFISNWLPSWRLGLFFGFYLLFWALLFMSSPAAGFSYAYGYEKGEMSTGSGSLSILMVVSRRGEPFETFERLIRKELRQHLEPALMIRSIYVEDSVCSSVVSLPENSLRDRKSGMEAGLAQKIRSVCLQGGVPIFIGTRAAACSSESLPPGCRAIAAFVVKRGCELYSHRAQVSCLPMEIPITDQLKLLSEMLPAGRVAVFSNDQHIPDRISGLEIVRIDPAGRSLSDLLAEVVAKGGKALLITPEPSLFSSPALVNYTLLWGLRQRIAVVGLSSGYVDKGALFALEPDIEAIAEKVGKLVTEMMNGDSFQQEGSHYRSVPWRLYINLNTARRIGISVPESLMGVADRVVR